MRDNEVIFSLARTLKAISLFYCYGIKKLNVVLRKMIEAVNFLKILLKTSKDYYLI